MELFLALKQLLKQSEADYTAAPRAVPQHTLSASSSHYASTPIAVPSATSNYANVVRMDTTPADYSAAPSGTTPFSSYANIAPASLDYTAAPSELQNAPSMQPSSSSYGLSARHNAATGFVAMPPPVTHYSSFSAEEL